MKKQSFFHEKGLHVHHTSYSTFVDVHGTFILNEKQLDEKLPSFDILSWAE